MNLIQQILDKYDIHDGVVHPVQKGYRNRSWRVTLPKGEDINVMIYKSEPGILETIHRANAVSEYLAEREFPTRVLRDPRILKLSGTRTTYACIYNYLPGATIPWEGYTMRHIKLLGKTLSDMHASLRDYDTVAIPSVIDEYSHIISRMAHYFAQADVAEAMQQKLHLTVPARTLTRCADTLEAARRLSHTQALHMDFVRGNILFSGAHDALTISGILDFEKTAEGNPLFDIARTLAFLLIDCKYKDEEKVRKYFLYSGYHKHGASPLLHVKLLEPLVDLFLLYDFYKFLRHNPYESLSANAHYIRTRDLLIQRGRIL